MKLRKGDTILVISGKDKGKKGKIIEAFPKQSRIIVESMNLKKKHIKPKRSGEAGQIAELPASFPCSKAKIVCSKCGRTARIGYKTEGKKKYRICKKCSQEI